VQAILAAVDLSAVLAFVVAAVLIGVGVAFAFAAGAIAKRVLDGLEDRSGYEPQSWESYKRDGDTGGL